MKPWTAFAAAGLVGGGVCAADLPANYTRLNWVESTGRQAVITDYVPMNTDSVETKLMFTSISSGTAVFDAREPEAKHRYTLLLLADGKFRMDWNALNETVQKFTLEAGVPYDICVAPDKRRLTVDQDPAQLSIKLSEEKVQKGLRLFAAQTVNAADGSLSMYASIRLFSFTVKDKAGNVQLDLVPCTTDAGEVGLWDTVAGKFHGSSTDQGLLPGPRTVSVTLTAYSTATGVASLAFAGVDREMNLIARAGDEAKVAATVPSGTTALDVAVPCFETATPSEVRFVLSDFVPVTAIKGFGHHAVDTGIVPDATTTIELGVAKSAASRSEFGNNAFYMADQGGKLFYGFLGSYSSLEGTYYSDGSLHKLVWGPNGGYVDNTRIIGPISVRAPTDLTIALFGRRTDATTVGQLATATISYAKIWKGGKLVRGFVSCVKDGVGQFYDTCQGRFYANGDGCECDDVYGVFSAGPLDIAAIDDWACGVSASVSEVQPAPSVRTVAVTSYDAATGVAELAFSAGTEAKLLYVAKGDCDKGEDAANWGEFSFLGEVAANATAGSYTVPAALRGQGTLRFFLVQYLPEGQRPVEVCESVEATGASYVATPYRPVNTDKVAAKVMVTDAKNAASVFCARDLAATKRFAVIQNAASSGKFAFRADRCNGALSSAANYEAGTIYDLYADFAGLKLYVDRTPVLDLTGGQTGGQEETVPANLWIFAMSAMNTGTPSSYVRAKLYSFSVSNRLGTCVMDLVPCVKDGVGALYDRVTGTYMKSTTATPLVANGEPHVTALKGVESVSGPVRGANLGIAFDVDVSAWTVTVTVGEGTTGGRVFLAAAKEDCGESVLDWPDVAEIGTVTVEDRTLNAALPVEWKKLRAKNYRVFLACAEAYCPYDQRIASLASSGQEYIDTGIVPDGTTAIELVETKTPSSSSEFGVAGMFYLFDNTGSTWYGFFGTDGNNNVPYSDGRQHKIAFGPAGGYVDDRTVVEGPLSATKTTDLTMTLFGRRNSATEVASKATVSICSAKIWKGGKLVRGFVPCVKDGVGYLYDKVGGELYGNGGAGSFALGSLKGGAVVDREIVGASAVKQFRSGLFIVVQ